MNDPKQISKLLRFCDSNGGCCDCFGRDECYSANRADLYTDAADVIDDLMKTSAQQRWISVHKYLPKMHDAGILKKIGIMQRSRKVIAAITDGNEYIVDNNAELRDGKWYSDTIRMLEAGKKQFSVTHWMQLPQPPRAVKTSMYDNCQDCMEDAPYQFCCKIECGEHEFCRDCNAKSRGGQCPNSLEVNRVDHH